MGGGGVHVKKTGVCMRSCGCGSRLWHFTGSRVYKNRRHKTQNWITSEKQMTMDSLLVFGIVGNCSSNKTSHCSSVKKKKSLVKWKKSNISYIYLVLFRLFGVFSKRSQCLICQWRHQMVIYLSLSQKTPQSDLVGRFINISSILCSFWS